MAAVRDTPTPVAAAPAVTGHKKTSIQAQRFVNMKHQPVKNSKLISNGMSSSSSSKSDIIDTDPEMQLEDELTNEKLRQLEQIFEEADEDGGGGLDMDEFRNAMREAMGGHLTDEELDRLFMKVDTNCDGTVDWDEYLSYMLLEYREKDAMHYINQSKPLPQNMKMVQNMNRYQRHHDSIIKIEHIPVATKSTNNISRLVWDTHGRYISMTKDGVINFWNMSLNHLKRFKLPSPKTLNKVIGLWVTCMTAMPNVNLLCISSTSGTLMFYDINAYRFKPILTITDLDICITCISYWVDPNCFHHSLLLFGDARGNIMALDFDDCPTMCFLQPTSKHFSSQVEFSDLLKNTTCGVKAYKLPYVHQDLVIDVKFFPNLHGCFLSCCRRNDTAMYMGDVEAKKSSYFPVNKGVQTFDYCTRTNIIVTGGKDTLVRVWNPYVPSKPVMILHGQKSPILYVFVHEEHEHIISISQEKDIVVFDMTTQTSIQTIKRKHVAMGPRVLSAACFNPYRKALVLGSNQLSLFEHQEEDIISQTLHSHNKPVSVVAYNSLFDQLVSGGADSVVCVWNANTGERVMQFSAHKVPEKGGGETEVEITTMRFDPTLRRLITAARDGSVKIWNFNNGALLRTLDAHNPSEVTGIACPKQRILTTGWNRVITVYVDSYDDDTVRIWDKRHREDITALDFKAPSAVASGSYDGDILIWTLETGHVTIRLNAHISTKPISMLEMVQGSRLDITTTDTAGDGGEDTTTEEFDLKDWMAYNTHRASIAAAIPFMTRRQSMALRKNAVFMPIRAGKRSKLPTISSRQNLLDDSSNVHLNISVNNNNNNNNNNKSSHSRFAEKQQVSKNVKLQPAAAKKVTKENNQHIKVKQNSGNEEGHRDSVRNRNNNNLLLQNPMLCQNAREGALSPISGMFGNRRRSRRCSQQLSALGKVNENFSEVVKYKYDAYLRRNEAAIERLLFLHRRNSDQATATLIAVCAGGWIRFWSVDHNGGLLGQFNAGHNPGDSVQAACLDDNEEYLITGDSAGYIKVWDISEYCSSSASRFLSKELKRQEKCEKFPLMFNQQNKLRKKHVRQSRHRPPPQCTDPDSTWIPPPLLNSFRGHLGPISDITYMPRGERIATSSVDCSIRIWTIYGRFIGICGQDTPWQWNPAIQEQQSQHSVTTALSTDILKTPDERTHKKTIFERGKTKRKLPGDVRRVASATTLRVLHGGTRPHWRLAKNIVMVWVPLLRLSRKKKSEAEEEEQEQEVPLSKPTSVCEPLCLEKLEPCEMTSAVLGKSYKATRKHQPLPVLPKIRQFQNQCDVYSSLPCYDLAPIKEQPPPQVVLDIQERHRNLMHSVKEPPKSKMQKGVRRLRNIRLMSLSRSPGSTDPATTLRHRRMSRKVSTSSSVASQLGVSPSAARPKLWAPGASCGETCV